MISARSGGQQSPCDVTVPPQSGRKKQRPLVSQPGVGVLMFPKIAIEKRALMGLHRANEIIRGNRFGGLPLKGKPGSGQQKEGGQDADRNQIQLD